MMILDVDIIMSSPLFWIFPTVQKKPINFAGYKKGTAKMSSECHFLVFIVSAIFYIG